MNFTMPRASTDFVNPARKFNSSLEVKKISTEDPTNARIKAFHH